MPKYAVSFELKSDDTYGSRYTSLMEQIRKAPSTQVWTETTSFALVSTTETLDTFEHRLYYSTTLSSTKDKLLVIDHANSSAIARGPFLYPATLGSHFKTFVQK